MSNDPNPLHAPDQATCDLLRLLAARFVAAGVNHSLWRHCYARVVSEAADRCLYPPGWDTPAGVPWSRPTKINFADPDEPRSIMAGPGSRRGEGWEVFEDLAFEIWGLLPQFFNRERTQYVDATEPWLAIIYDRLVNTRLVKTEQRRDEMGALWEIRALTINPFEASAKTIDLLFREWGIDDSQQTSGAKPVAQSNCVKLFGPGEQPIVNGKKKAILTKARYDVVQALLEAGESGLSKDDLDKKSGHSEARKLLNRLAEKDEDWVKVIRLPGKGGMGTHYRIL